MLLVDDKLSDNCEQVLYGPKVTKNMKQFTCAYFLSQSKFGQWLNLNLSMNVSFFPFITI